MLQEVIREKLPDLDEYGEPFNRNNYRPVKISFEEMNTEINSIEIHLIIKLNNNDDAWYFGVVG